MSTASGAGAEPSRRLVPIIIGCALFMQTLDSTIVANALPTMARELAVDPISLNIVITSYLISTAVFLPISGWLADKYGARPVFVWAIVLFTASSILCGLSQNLGQLVGARMLQGAAGAMLMPVGRLLLLKSTPKDDLIRAMAILTMPAMVGPIVGPLLGGFIVTFSSWRTIFFINVPVGIAGALLVKAFVPNVREDSPPPLDFTGFVLTGLGFAGVIYGFENVARGEIPRWLALTLLIGGIVCIALFAWRARRIAHPILDFSLLRIPTFAASLIGGLFTRFMIGAAPFLLALLLQMGFGLTAFEAGAITFVGAAGALLMKTTAPPIIRRLGFRNVLVWNALVSAILFAAAALFSPQTPHALILAVLFVGGFFRSLQFTALNTLAFADVPQERMSRASSLSSMGQQLALSMGVGVGAIILDLLQNFIAPGAAPYATVAPAFAIIALLSLASIPFFLQLAPDAGDEVAGHRSRVRVEEAVPPPE